MRVAFAGTPRAAVPSLEAILRSGHELVAVITRPDAPAGRGRRPAVSPVGERAAEAGLEVLKPARPRDPGFLDRLRAIGPDCCPVTGYGALLPQAALDIPARGWVNLHFSLLPAWRGAAPVQHAVLHGDDITGATTFRIVKELDAGPVFGVLTEPIRPDDTAGDLLARIAVSGADLLVATLDGIESGQLRPQPQPSEGVSFAPKIGVADARVDWTLPAAAIGRLIRACTPAPGAWTELNGTRLKLGPVTEAGPSAQRTGTPAAAGPGAAASGGSGAGQDGTPGLAAARLGPGELAAGPDGVLAGTGTGPVLLGQVQPAGKRRMTAAEWARGLRLGAGLPSGAAGPGPGQPRPRLG
jgi:methionyl-tRNA formyltransferase